MRMRAGVHVSNLSCRSVILFKALDELFLEFAPDRACVVHRQPMKLLILLSGDYCARSNSVVVQASHQAGRQLRVRGIVPHGIS